MEEMREVLKEKKFKEHLMEAKTDDRFKQVCRPWEEGISEVADGSDLVVEKEELTELLRVKLDTHNGKGTNTPPLGCVHLMIEQRVLQYDVVSIWIWYQTPLGDWEGFFFSSCSCCHHHPFD